MAEKHWLDTIIEKYGNSGEVDHSTGSYEWRYGANGTDSDCDGKIEFDCSHFLNQVLKDMGYDSPYQSSGALNKNSSYYDGIDEASLQKGDIVLFNGHVGFFYGYDEKGNMLVYSSSGNPKKGTDRGPAITPAKEWFGTPTKFLRPKPNLLSSLPTKSKTSDTTTRRDPLILDLDGDGVIQTLGMDAGIHFDHDGNGFKELSGWVAPGDGMLMLDRNISGTLDNGSELFGDFTPLANGMLAVNGFQALAQFDTNGDGKIDVNDPIWSQLKVWQHDPEATDLGDPDTSGKMSTLDEIGIKAIYLDSTITNMTDASGNTETRAGSFEWTDGRTSAISEYRLQRNTSDAIPTDFLEVPSDIAALPDLQGYGNVYSLHQAIVRDTSGQLKTFVESFMSETNPANRASILEQIIYKWTGADGVAPDARGPFMDGRKVVVLEKFYGDQPMNPDAGLAIAWKQSYQEISEIFYSSLMTQTHMKSLFDTINYAFDENTMQIKGDLSIAITELQNSLNSDPAWETRENLYSKPESPYYDERFKKENFDWKANRNTNTGQEKVFLRDIERYRDEFRRIQNGETKLEDPAAMKLWDRLKDYGIPQTVKNYILIRHNTNASETQRKLYDRRENKNNSDERRAVLCVSSL